MTQSMCPANNLVMLELFWMNCKLIFHFATPHSIISVVCLYIEMSRSIHLLPQPCHLLQGIMFHHLEVSHKWHGLILSKRPNKNGEDKMVCFFFLKKKWIRKVANLNTSTKQTIKDTVLKLQKLFVVLWVYRTNHQRCYFIVSCGSTKQIIEDVILLCLVGLQNKSLEILFCCVFWVYRTNHWRYCFVASSGSTEQITEDTVLKLWKLFCCVFPDDCAKCQVCVTMAALKRILKTNVPHFALSLLAVMEGTWLEIIIAP